MAYMDNWGNEEQKLKYTYTNENSKYNSEVKNIQMTKEELEEYLKGLEVKNRWKTRKVL